MLTRAMTQKQRVAMEAREAAQREGRPLSEYAEAQGLAIRELYDALASLRRNGTLPRSGRRPRSKFVAVRVAAQEPPRPNALVMCRIVSRGGHVIECVQWPPATWLASLAGKSADAAA